MKCLCYSLGLLQFSFLDLFSTLRPRAECAIPGRSVLFSSWLQLLVNLTRYGDGQQMVLKQPGIAVIYQDITYGNMARWYCPSHHKSLEKFNLCSVTGISVNCWLVYCPLSSIHNHLCCFNNVMRMLQTVYSSTPLLQICHRQLDSCYY